MAKTKIIKPKISKYSWNDFDKDADILSEKIKESKYQIDMICGIIRGGLPLATTLSHRLKKPMDTSMIQLRDGTTRREYWIVDMLDDNKNILFVDDICDSGGTFDWILKHYSIKKRNKISQVRFVSLVQDPEAKLKSDFYAREKKDKSWILFPWEVE